MTFWGCKAPTGSWSAPSALHRARQVERFSSVALLRSKELPNQFWRDVEEYIPDGVAAREWWCNVIETFKTSATAPPVDETDTLTRDLSDEERKRMRFAHSWGVPVEFTSLGPRYGRGFSLYFAVLPMDVAQVVRSTLLGTLGIGRFRSRAALDAALGKLSDTAKKLGPQFHRYWMAFVNLNTLGGYRDVQPVGDQLADLEAWATGDKVHTFPDDDGIWTEEAFLRTFKRGVENVLAELPSVDLANDTAPTVAEFASDPSWWGNTGATSSRVSVALRVGDRGFSAARDKMTTAMLTSPQQVQRTLLDPWVTQHNKPIMKREPAKVRAVVNSDDKVYLKMQYVSTWLERALRGNRYSTLFMTTAQRNDLWRRMAEDSLRPVVKMPLDQSHFDWQQNRRMISVCIDCIADTIAARAAVRVRADLLRVTQTIKYSLTHGGVIHIRELARDIPIEKGVMSGWRWTALLDTLMNVGELHAANELAARWGIHGAVRSFVAQGDDDQVTLASPAAAIAIAEAYRAMNFEVNPGKFWVADGRDEFLRQVAVDGQVRGYISRTINNLLWRSPVTSDPPAGELSIRSQLAQWNLVVARGGDRERVLSLMLRDMSGRSAMSKRAIWDFLRTPAPYGGCGLTGFGVPSVPTVITQVPKEKAFNVESQLPGLIEVERWMSSQGLPARVLRRAIRARIPRQGLRLPPDRPVFLRPTVVNVTPVPTAAAAPPLPRVREDVPEFVRTQVVAELAQSRAFDQLRDYYTPETRGTYDHWRRALSQNAFALLLTSGLPLQQPTVWGRGTEQTSQVWTWCVNGVMGAAWFGRRLSVGWFRAKATAAVQHLRVGLGRLALVSG